MNGRRTVIVALVVVGIALTAGLVIGNARQSGQISFRSNGSPIAGWYWLRSAGQTATWTFDASELQGARNVYINFNPLVTNGVNGGAGYDTTVTAKVEGTKKHTASIHVINPYRPVDPANSGGVGYQCYGHSSGPIPANVYKGASKITVTVSYPFPNGAHVAVNGGCMALGYSK